MSIIEKRFFTGHSERRACPKSRNPLGNAVTLLTGDPFAHYYLKPFIIMCANRRAYALGRLTLRVTGGGYAQTVALRRLVSLAQNDIEQGQALTAKKLLSNVRQSYKIVCGNFKIYAHTLNNCYRRFPYAVLVIRISAQRKLQTFRNLFQRKTSFATKFF